MAQEIGQTPVVHGTTTTEGMQDKLLRLPDMPHARSGIMRGTRIGAASVGGVGHFVFFFTLTLISNASPAAPAAFEAAEPVNPASPKKPRSAVV